LHTRIKRDKEGSWAARSYVRGRRRRQLQQIFLGFFSQISFNISETQLKPALNERARASCPLHRHEAARRCGGVVTFLNSCISFLSHHHRNFRTLHQKNGGSRWWNHRRCTGPPACNRLNPPSHTTRNAYFPTPTPHRRPTPPPLTPPTTTTTTSTLPAAARPLHTRLHHTQAGRAGSCIPAPPTTHPPPLPPCPRRECGRCIDDGGLPFAVASGHSPHPTCTAAHPAGARLLLSARR